MKQSILLSLLMLGLSFAAISQTQPKAETILTTQEQIMIDELSSFHMQYLLDAFSEGIIYFTEKEPAEGKLNYNILLNAIQYYDQKGKVLTMSADEVIDSVELGDHVLVPFGDGLAEIYHTENGPLVLHRSISYRLEKLVKGAYGSVLRSSYVQRVTSPSGETTLRDAFRFMNPSKEEMELTLNYQQKFYFPQPQGQHIELSSRRSVSRAFPEHRSQVNSFIKENKIDFDSVKSLKQLASYLHRL